MKREDISEIISMTDTRFIEEAAAPVKKRSLMPIFVSAAVFVLIIAAGFIFSDAFGIPAKTENTTDGENATAVQEIATAPAAQSGTPEINIEIVTEPAIEIAPEIIVDRVTEWNALTICEKYSEVTVGEITYSSQIKSVDKKHVLSHITDCTMTAYNYSEDKTYTHNASVYSIKGISTECAVAVKYENDNSYYVFVNLWYEPDTIGDFIADIDLKNTVIFGKAFANTYEYGELFSSYTHRVYEDFDDAIIWNMLLSDTEIKNVQYNAPYSKLAEIEVSLPMLGYASTAFCISGDGYIITNILGTQKCFFIGTEKTEAFAEYLKNNVKSTENTVVYEMNPDGSIPGKDEVQTTPAYNPNAGQSVPPSDPNAGQSTPGYNPDEEMTNETETVIAFEPSWEKDEPVTIPKKADEDAPAVSITPLPGGLVTETTATYTPEP